MSSVVASYFYIDDDEDNEMTIVEFNCGFLRKVTNE